MHVHTCAHTHMHTHQHSHTNAYVHVHTYAHGVHLIVFTCMYSMGLVTHWYVRIYQILWCIPKEGPRLFGVSDLADEQCSGESAQYHRGWTGKGYHDTPLHIQPIPLERNSMERMEQKQDRFIVYLFKRLSLKFCPSKNAFPSVAANIYLCESKDTFFILV